MCSSMSRSLSLLSLSLSLSAFSICLCRCCSLFTLPSSSPYPSDVFFDEFFLNRAGEWADAQILLRHFYCIVQLKSSVLSTLVRLRSLEQLVVGSFDNHLELKRLAGKLMPRVTIRVEQISRIERTPYY
jgi:hypothetical protein